MTEAGALVTSQLLPLTHMIFGPETEANTQHFTAEYAMRLTLNSSLTRTPFPLHPYPRTRTTLQQKVFPVLREVALRSNGGPAALFSQLVTIRYISTRTPVQDQALLLANMCLTHAPQPCAAILLRSLEQDPRVCLLFLSYIHDALRGKAYSAEHVGAGEGG